jgi:hypothetical protein
MRPLRICIYAFSGTALFFRALIDECAKHGDQVEWSIIYPQGHFCHVTDGVIPTGRRFYLHKDFVRAFRDCCEADIQRAMESGEGLQVALLKDKSGYRRLDGEDQLRRGATIDSCYRDFLMRVKPDFILFPDLEVVDGFVLMNIAHELGLGVLYFSGVRVLGGGYFSTDSYETLPPYFGKYTIEYLALARRLVAGFHAGRPLQRGSAYPRCVPPKPSWLRRLVLTSWLRWRYERLHATEETLLMRVKRNIRPLMGKLRLARFDLTQAHYFHVKSIHDQLPEKYILYLAHVTPESSINGLAPYFVDQFRAIDALLLSLPNGHRLVVKEHPAMRGSRWSSFYQELRRRPGLILAHPVVDTRHFLQHASIIATVTGTVGLEAFLLDKPCLSFGPNLLCQASPALPGLKAVLTDLATQWKPPSEAQKEIDFADPWLSPTVMAPENIRATREYLWLHLRRLEELEKLTTRTGPVGL